MLLRFCLSVWFVGYGIWMDICCGFGFGFNRVYGFVWWFVVGLVSLCWNKE